MGRLISQFPSSRAQQTGLKKKQQAIGQGSCHSTVQKTVRRFHLVHHDFASSGCLATRAVDADQFLSSNKSLLSGYSSISDCSSPPIHLARFLLRHVGTVANKCSAPTFFPPACWLSRAQSSRADCCIFFVRPFTSNDGTRHQSTAMPARAAAPAKALASRASIVSINVIGPKFRSVTARR